MNFSVLFPGYWAVALLIAQCRIDGLVSCTVLCVSVKDSKKERKLSKPRSPTFYILNQRPELHAGLSVLSKPL